MRRAERFTGFTILLALSLLLSLLSPAVSKPALAEPANLMWGIVDTPSLANNIIVPSEINVIAIGSDGRTFYAVDIPNGELYKSADGGVTWGNELTGHLPVASLPAWNIAVAPDDVNFVVAVTTGAPNGPKQVFISEDGGANWEDANFPALAVGEYIGCLDISIEYGSGNRDIAVGTRTGGGGGKVYVRKVPGFAGWVDQLAPAGDVVALKFSPNYLADSSIVVISATAAGTFLNLGSRDIDANTTVWNNPANYPVEITTAGSGTSPKANEIISADLELPSDFLATDPGSLRRYYISTDVDPAVAAQHGVYRIDGTEVYRILKPTTARISSIAYYGTYASGELLAGEVKADASVGKVYIWRTSNPTSNDPCWYIPDKPPTGGGNSGYANAQVAWSPDGSRAYCGTSSANLSLGGTGWPVAGKWPFGYTAAGGGSFPLDESAFSVSPYASFYETLLDITGKGKDGDVGNIWNQLSLIDTEISFLSDAAALEVPEDSVGYEVLYLASINIAVVPVANFDSVWRSTGYPLGRTWERIYTDNNTSNDIILRLNPRTLEDGYRSETIVFAYRFTDDIRCSEDEGQFWQVLMPGFNVKVTDLTLASDEVMYILDNTYVRRGSKSDTIWRWQGRVDTYLDSGHTIATPLKNPKDEDWVIVGEAGPPSGQGRVAYADFSQTPREFKPALGVRTEMPVPGNAHVIADDKFEKNKIIYAASDGISGKVYRWVVDESTDWDELEPPNSQFYGLAQRHDVLYGLWNIAVTATTPPGADRTLYPRKAVPPATELEWDDLTEGLPTPGDVNFPVSFTREPASLKISSNAKNNLWAIDNRVPPTYDWANEIGCLWAYTDILIKAGPWTTAPPDGDVIRCDAVSGRASEINFGWRQLDYVRSYELELAKDGEFTIVILDNDNIIPADSLAPACYFPAGGLSPTRASAIASWGNIECGHGYYWRVRARRATTGEVIRSPWSSTASFTIKAGLPAKAKYTGITLLKPTPGARDISRSPAFSWSPMPGSTAYEFILAKDTALAQVVAEATVVGTAYEYDGLLDPGATYYWRVRAIQPVPSDPSPTVNFAVKVEQAPVLPSAPSPLLTWTACVAITIFVLLLAAIVCFLWVSRRPNV